jgi:hypothetical protein
MLEVITLVNNKCIQLFDTSQMGATGDYNRRHKGGSLKHHSHHPWDFFPWPQHSSRNPVANEVFIFTARKQI